jgi:hypothetical protein
VFICISSRRLPEIPTACDEPIHSHRQSTEPDTQRNLRLPLAGKPRRAKAFIGNLYDHERFEKPSAFDALARDG